MHVSADEPEGEEEEDGAENAPFYYYTGVAIPPAVSVAYDIAIGVLDALAFV